MEYGNFELSYLDRSWRLARKDNKPTPFPNDETLLGLWPPGIEVTVWKYERIGKDHYRMFNLPKGTSLVVRRNFLTQASKVLVDYRDARLKRVMDHFRAHDTEQYNPLPPLENTESLYRVGIEDTVLEIVAQIVVDEATLYENTVMDLLNVFGMSAATAREFSRKDGTISGKEVADVFFEQLS